MPPPNPPESPIACTVCGTRLVGTQCPRCLLSLGSSFGLPGDEAEGDGLLDPHQVRGFGDYELLEEIARGGMGIVYRARQISLNREVAVKMILAGELAGKESLRMFQREAHAAANLHHPNIVPVYEIGEHEMQHYFTMRFVPGGKTIADCAAARRSDRQAIAVAAAQVARAVAHAHSRGVLHRDLKPSNILWDDEAGPQVTDFGLAKLLNQSDGTATRAAQVIGSPSYMAPEQMGGRVAEISTATDVYGLGAVLYEMLAGKPPFSGASAIETMRRAAEEAPAPLPDVPKDLRTVCLKCLAKKPEDRYASAAALAEDLERYARGEPVSAVPLSTSQTVWRWAQRRPRIAALIGLCGALLIAGVSGITWQWRNAVAARAETTQALGEVTRANALQGESLARLQWEEIGHWLDRGDTARSLAYLASVLRKQPERWQAAMYAMSIVDENRFPLLAGPEVTPAVRLTTRARLAPDGGWFASAGEDRVVRIWDTASGKETLQIPHASPVTALAVAQGPWKLAVALGDGTLTVLTELAAAPVMLVREASAPVLDLQFSADGSRLMARRQDRVEIWDTSAPEAAPAIVTFSGGIKGASLSADGSRVLVWNAERAAVWDTVSQRELLSVAKRQEIRGAVLAAGGKRMACLDGKFHARVWDVDSGAALPDVESELPARHYLALNGSGTRLTFAGWGNDITVHDTASGMKVSGAMRHNFHVDSVTPSPDGQRMFTYGWDELLHIWDAESGRSLQSPVRQGGGRRGVTIAPSHDGRRVLIHRPARGTMPDAISVWDSTTHSPVLRHRVDGFRNFNSGAMSPDGTLGWMGTDGYGPTRVHVYEIGTNKVLLDAPTAGEVYGALFSPEMQRIFVVTNAGALHGFSLMDGQPLWPPNRQSGGVIPASILHDGSRLVIGYNTGHLRVVDPATGTAIWETGGLGEVRTIRFAPDRSGRFLSGGNSGIVHLWDVHTGAKLQSFTGHSGTVLSAVWTSDSRRMATASVDGTVRLWDIATGQQLVPAMPHLTVPSHLDISPDGTRLATSTRDGTARLWDAHTGQPLSPLLSQGQACTTVRFTADGAVFFVHDHDGFRFWDTATALPVTLHYQEPVAGGFAFDSDAFHTFMTPDGTRVFLSYAKNDGSTHTIPQPRSAVPPWFPDFLEMLAQMSLDEHGALRMIPHTPAAAFAEKLNAQPADEPYAVWARKILGEEGR